MPTTHRFPVAVAAIIAGLIAFTSAAHAAEPLRIDSGRLASVAIDEAGTAHIAWAGNESLYSSLQYCRLPEGATSCAPRLELVPKRGDSVSRPFVVVAGSSVYVLQYRYGLTDGLTPDKFAAIVLFASSNGGASFDGGTYVGTVPFSDAVAGPGLNVSLATHAVTQGELFQQVPLGGGAASAQANLSPTLPYIGAVGLDGTTPVVVFADGSANAFFRRYTGSGDPNVAGNWAKQEPIGYADWAHLAGGPSGLFMLATRSDGHAEVRRFTGDTFAPGVSEPDWTGETPQDHIAQDGGGMLHVLLPRITARCCPLLYSYSRDGQAWTSVSYPLPELATGVRGAFLADHRGIAVWHRGSGEQSAIYALRLGPRVALALPKAGDPPATARIGGGSAVVRIDGSLRVPGGIPESEVCGGRIAAVVRSASGSNLRKRTLRVGSDCDFAGRIVVPRSRVGAGRVRLVLKLKASKTAKAAKRAYKLPLRR